MRILSLLDTGDARARLGGSLLWAAALAASGFSPSGARADGKAASPALAAAVAQPRGAESWAPGGATVHGFSLEPSQGDLGVVVALATPAPVLTSTELLAQADAAQTAEPVPAIAEVFTAERARILLRSLTVPGWGQATAGRTTAATVFGLIEASVWGSFTAFRIQEQLRRDAYERSARLLAGIDLRGRDEEFRRIVGSYLSSDQYNLYVVNRDAANLYLSDPEHPDYVSYRRYIAEHELRGADLWNWQTDGDLLRYRGQRKDAQRASIRANSTLAVAVIHRLVSAVDAARGHRAKAKREGPEHSWNLEVAPPDPADATAFRIGVRTRF